MDFKDYYSTLGVAKTANAKEVKQAFRKLARKHHPDVNPGDKTAESKFKEISEAYEVLSDSEKRAKYERFGEQWKAYSQAGARRGGGGTGQDFGFEFDLGSSGGAGINLGDFFESI